MDELKPCMTDKEALGIMEMQLRLCRRSPTVAEKTLQANEIATASIRERIERNIWIPVKDRLPEEGQEVLLWAECYPYSSGKFHYDMIVYNPRVYQPVIDYTTHWMPLPEPPKEEQT